MDRDSGRELTIERRRQLVKDIWIRRGITNQKQIVGILAEEFDITVTQPTVGRDLKALRKLTNAITAEEIKAFLVQGYMLTWNESLQAWELSKQDKETQVQEMVESGKADDRAKTQIKTEGQSGNPSHMRNAQEALRALRDIFGIDAVKSGNDENPFVIKVKYDRTDGTSEETPPETA
jgi:hypothetical protein